MMNVLRKSDIRSVKPAMKRVPYMLVVGQKEEENGLISVRSRFEGDEGQKELNSFIDDVKAEIRTRARREELVE